jgi:membrane-associated phospholipid phosphatase
MARFSGWRALAALVLACCSSLGPSPALADDAAEPPAVPGDRKPVRDVLRGVRTLGSDTWFVFSSPARLNRNGAAWLAGTALVTAVVYTNDEAISRAFQRQHGNPVFDAALKLGNNIEPVGYMGRMMPYYVGALGLGYAFRNRPLTVIPGQVIESHLIAGGVRNFSKLLIGRRRPFEDEGPRSFEFAGGTSFPSGHTSIAFEIATILSLHAKRWPVTAATYALATTVAMQRVDSGGHWPSDVLVPAVTGTFIARTIVRRHEERVWAIVPSFARDGATGLQLVVAF